MHTVILLFILHASMIMRRMLIPKILSYFKNLQTVTIIAIRFIS
jgi:hypothetical protein